MSSKQIVSLSGEDWRPVRATFSPIFTSGKLKAMGNIVAGVAERLAESLVNYVFIQNFTFS